MRCLCCGKEIPDNARPEERESGWHRRCAKRFFGKERVPVPELTGEILEALAADSLSLGITVPGVQKKLSMHLSDEREFRLTVRDYPAGFILKPQTPEYAQLPEAEQLVMQMADLTGIRTVPHALIRLEDGNVAYLTRRIDRGIQSGSRELFAMEDFCQLDGRLTADKYRGSYERCAKIIQKYSVQPGLDLSELFLRLVFCFVTGNSDMHLKNFSLIERVPAGREYVLSAAYDLLPVNVILPEDPEQFALTMNGKKRNLHPRDFLVFADNAGIPRKSAERMIRKVTGMQETYLELIRQSALSGDLQKSFTDLLQSRCGILYM